MLLPARSPFHSPHAAATPPGLKSRGTLERPRRNARARVSLFSPVSPSVYRSVV